MKRFAVALLVLLGGAASASAATITHVWTGVVTTVSGFTTVAPGDTYRLAVTLDSGTPDIFPGDPNMGQYAIDGMSVSLGNAYSSFGTGNFGNLTLILGTSGGPDQFYQDGCCVSGLAPLEGRTLFVAVWAFLSDVDATALASDGLSALPIDVSQFENNYFFLRWDAGQGEIGGTITSFEIVPEPSPSLLAVGASFGLLALRRRNSKRR